MYVCVYVCMYVCMYVRIIYSSIFKICINFYVRTFVQDLKMCKKGILHICDKSLEFHLQFWTIKVILFLNFYFYGNNFWDVITGWLTRIFFRTFSNFFGIRYITFGFRIFEQNSRKNTYSAAIFSARTKDYK